MTTTTSPILLPGDCLDVLPREVEPGSVDLCYHDPPFFTGRDHGAFDDRWRWDAGAERDLGSARQLGPEGFGRRLDGLLDASGDGGPLRAYLCFLSARLAAVRPTLAPHAALFVHCDPTAGPYLRVLCDALLGRSSFVNEVVWRYRRWPIRQKAFQRMHDTLLFYAVDPLHPDRRFEVQYERRAASTLKRWGASKIRASHRPDGSRAPSTEETESSRGAPLSDVWDLSILAPSARERTGYPTQKPLKLLARVIETASAPGDLVLDPFCGSGTTLVAALAAGRRGVGIDVNEDALRVARARLDQRAPSISRAR